MLNNLQQLESDDLRFHIFIGTVVANNDPEQLERIKVSIPKIFSGADLSLYPWCAPRDKGGIATAQGVGSFGLVPSVGSKVFVLFQEGDPLFALYWCAPVLKGMRPAEANVNYPNRYGWKDPAGNVFYVDVQAGDAKFLHHSGAYIQIANDGKITMHSPVGIDQLTPGDVNINAGGAVNITSGGNTNVTAAQIHLNES